MWLVRGHGALLIVDEGCGAGRPGHEVCAGAAWEQEALVASEQSAAAAAAATWNGVTCAERLTEAGRLPGFITAAAASIAAEGGGIGSAAAAQVADRRAAIAT